MNEFKRIMKLIESQDNLCDSQRLRLALVCLESAFDQLETETQERNACADMLRYQRGVWQDRSYWSAKSREHYAKLESAS